LSLTPCCPIPCTTTRSNEKESTKKRRIVQQESNCSRKRAINNVGNWEIKKMLTETDVLGVTCRLRVGRKVAEEFVVPKMGADDVENGVSVKIRDCDTHSFHSLVFKKCSSGSFGFGGNWMKDFVNRRGLKGGNLIGLHWDQNNQHFDFSVLEAN
jgi:hypothetical protein